MQAGWFLIVLLATAIIIWWGVCRVNLYVDLTYRRTEGDDIVVIRIYALQGLISYTIKIPVVKAEWQDELVWLESEIKESKGIKAKKSFLEKHILRRILDVIWHKPRLAKRIAKRISCQVEQYNIFLDRIHSHVYCDRFYCKICLGTDDAAATCLLIGCLRALNGALLVWLRPFIHFSTAPVVQFVPVFGDPALAVDLKCIFRIRLGNVINAMQGLRLQES